MSYYENAEFALYTDAKELVFNTKLDESIIFRMIIRMMELVERYTNLSGQQKKEMVIKTFKRIVDEESKKLNNENLKLLIKMISGSVIENMIDMIVSASKRELNLNKKSGLGKISLFFKSLCSCTK